MGEAPAPYGRVPGRRFHMTRRRMGLAFALAGLVVLFNRGGQGQTQQELLVRRATIVNVDGRTEGDIRVRGEKIAEIGRNLTAGPGATELDARGMLVLPGGIDPHVHLNGDTSEPPRPGAPVDDYTSGSAAAIAGGVTTISNMVSKQPNETVDAFITRVRGQVEKSAIADMMLTFMVGNDPAWLTPEALNTLATNGLTSSKTFMRIPA